MAQHDSGTKRKIEFGMYVFECGKFAKTNKGTVTYFNNEPINDAKQLTIQSFMVERKTQVIDLTSD